MKRQTNSSQQQQQKQQKIVQQKIDELNAFQQQLQAVRRNQNLRWKVHTLQKK